MRDSLLTIWKEELGLSLVHTAAFLIAFVIAAALALTVYTALQGGDGDEGARSDVIIGRLRSVVQWSRLPTAIWTRYKRCCSR